MVDEFSTYMFALYSNHPVIFGTLILLLMTAIGSAFDFITQIPLKNTAFTENR